MVQIREYSNTWNYQSLCHWNVQCLNLPALLFPLVYFRFYVIFALFTSKYSKEVEYYNEQEQRFRTKSPAQNYYDFAPNFITISHQIYYDFSPNSYSDLLWFSTKFITISHQIHYDFAPNSLRFCTKFITILHQILYDFAQIAIQLSIILG